MVANANTEMNTTRVVSLLHAIMSWHMPKDFVMWEVNLYNEFVWAQENFDAGG